MIKQLFCFVISISLYSYSSAQNSQGSTSIQWTSTPDAAGLIPDRIKTIDRGMQSFIDSGWSNGVVGLIIRNGKVGYYKAFGSADGEGNVPLKRDAIFRIASQTKAITSVAVMILFEEGKLLLDDPLSRYIPEFRKPVVLDKFNKEDSSYTTVPAKREITIRQLLSHTSGIGYAQIGSQEANAIYAKNNISAGLGVVNERLGDVIKRLGTLPLMHQPGEKYTYGLNTDVLGYVVEVVSKMSLDEFFRTRIFAPLGMNDTYFYVPREKHARIVSLVTADSTGKFVLFPGRGGITGDYPKMEGRYYSGGAGLSSTISDYAIFLQMLLNGGEYNGKRILSRHTVDLMTTNQIGQLKLGLHAFGLGFRIVTPESEGLMPLSLGTYSWGGAFATQYWVDPLEKVVGLFFKQQYNDRHGELAEKFKAMAYGAMR